MSDDYDEAYIDYLAKQIQCTDNKLRIKELEKELAFKDQRILELERQVQGLVSLNFRWEDDLK